MKGANIHLDFPSVGATQNIIMGASLAQGKTVIENVAKEPEIVDLANYINEMVVTLLVLVQIPLLSMVLKN